MPAPGVESPRAVVERWIAAINDHDLDAVVTCFDPDYSDVAPARRGERVQGASDVRARFGRLLQEVSDLRAEMLGAVGRGDEVWVEWRLRGTRADGSPMEFTGVNIFEVRDGRLFRGRIYTELVRDAGGIEGQLRRMTAGSDAGSST